MVQINIAQFDFVTLLFYCSKRTRCPPSRKVPLMAYGQADDLADAYSELAKARKQIAAEKKSFCKLQPVKLQSQNLGLGSRSTFLS